MTEQTSIAAKMRVQYDDLLDLYNDAKRDENGALMEKYSKTLGNLAKQIKDQEDYERVTIPLKDCVTFTRELTFAIKDALNHHVKDSDLRAGILKMVEEGFRSTFERLKNGD